MSTTKFEMPARLLGDTSGKGKRCRVVECKVGGTTKVFSVGAVASSSERYLKPGRDIPLCKVLYSIAVYAEWQKNSFDVFATADLSTIYCEFPKEIAEDGLTFIANATDKDKKNWEFYFSKNPVAHETACAISVVGAVQLDLFNETVKQYDGSSRENTPVFFGDAILYGFAKEAKMTGTVLTEEQIEEMFALKAAEMTSLFSRSESPFDVTPEVEVKDGYWEWESYLAGEHILPYNWADRSKKLIPPLSVLEEFVPTEEFFRVIRLTEFMLRQSLERMEAGLTGAEAIKDCAVNIKLSGPPGAGKSFTAKCIAACLGMPFSLTSVNPKSHSGMVEGTTRMVGSEPMYVEAPLTIAQADGGCHAIEEPNTGDSEMVFSTLSQVVESPYILYRNGIEQVERHPLTVYFILYNKNCGSATMHPALLNRFNQPFRFEAPQKEDFIKMLVAHNPKANYGKGRTPKKVCSWVYKAYNCVINALDSSSGRDAAEAISLRSCFGTLKAIEAGEDPMSALRCLTDNIGDFDAELEEAVKKALRDMMKPL